MLERDSAKRLSARIKIDDACIGGERQTKPRCSTLDVSSLKHYMLKSYNPALFTWVC